ncbi:MAG TPA: hypothetical protein VI583_17010, partial [Cyclobacteriaceae bacterium]|nr:hypothetical protein [Cyclobacteriaceae bacterium]
MKTKKLLYLISGIVMSAFLVFSCKDDFTEEDFLLMQQEMSQQDFQNRLQELLYQAQLAKTSDSAMAVLQNMLSKELWMFQDSTAYAKQLDQLRNAGLLLSWTIQVQDNRTPVDSVDVNILTADIDQGRTLSAVTDANGYVTFMDVTVGRNLVRLNKTGYFSANVAVEFTTNTIQQTYAATYNNIVIRRQESSILPIFSSTSTETATITGLATIDLDLTNNTREFAPAGTTVRANISDALQDYDLIYPDTYPDDYTGGDAILSQTQRVINYNIEGGPNVGVGTV